MEVKQVQFVQANQSERLLRLERRQADDAAIKSVWNSPFPSVLGGTPQHGPVHMPSNEVFDEFDEQGQNLLGSLHLEADDEPIRRGATSRANSVRFDESTLQGSNWGQSTRHSGEFAPIRPGSGLGGHALMERTLSHRSDGRHSSAGHSVHSLHSVASGRASSLGLDNTFILTDREDDSPIDVPEPPPPAFLYLGSVPTIVRCWLTTNYAHDTLLYADVCSGSQKSTLDYSLIKELDLLGETHGDSNGGLRINLSVYFAEATVVQPHSRSSSPTRQVPHINAVFDVVGMDQTDTIDAKKFMRIFIGSDILRANSADLLLSQNRMTLYGNGESHEKLSVPFVRPEDDLVFKHIMTTNILPERIRLNASAPEFVSQDPNPQSTPGRGKAESPPARAQPDDSESLDAFSPTADIPRRGRDVAPGPASESGGESDRQSKEAPGTDAGGKEAAAAGEDKRRDAVGGIWSSWRHGTSASGSESGQRENGLSGYQPPARSRNMKVLKTQKAGSSSSARTGASYEPPPPARSSGEHRRKSQVSATGDQNGSAGSSTSVRWDMAKRSTSGSVAASGSSGGGSVTENKSRSSLDLRNLSSTALPRSANPVGGASAFSWMAPSSKPKASTAAAE
ncbi:Ubiquitin carboxyl-terminal hydrolase 19 [Pleurostoma richardsiae]|uniref:Ubiquitin carboxyl-terminal hydrolase 19 n=1 Tax=Pleurostoma richardsiae TaxID=41990 RepID=A0AA38VLX9_9PEZI|nr:Ubiquitin carboxyl-terminal hydrolase 19 [Pleurostoma richardsiae]